MPTAQTTGDVVVVTVPKSFATANTLNGLSEKCVSTSSQLQDKCFYLLIVPGPELTRSVSDPD